MRAVIADDQEMPALAAERCLERAIAPEPLETMTFRCCTEAGDWFSKTTEPLVDWLICDLNFEGLDMSPDTEDGREVFERLGGYQLIQRIRRKPWWRQLEIIVITQRETNSCRAALHALDVVHILNKPLRPKELIAFFSALRRRERLCHVD